MIDLQVRGCLAIEQAADEEGGADWLLTRRAGTAGNRRLARPGSESVMARYERTLLSALPRRRAIRLSQASQTKRWAVKLAAVYRQLNREAVRRGVVRPEVVGSTTGQEDGASNRSAASVVAAVRAFRSYLVRMQPAGADARDRFRAYLPYAVASGMTPQWAERFAGLEPPASAASGSYGYATNDSAWVLGAFADAACTHVHSAVSHGGFGGGGHHGGGHGYGGHGGGGHHGGV